MTDHQEHIEEIQRVRGEIVHETVTLEYKLMVPIILAVHAGVDDYEARVTYWQKHLKGRTFGGKIDLLESALKELIDHDKVDFATFEQIKSSLATVREVRNQAAHSDWSIIDGVGDIFLRPDQYDTRIHADHKNLSDGFVKFHKAIWEARHKLHRIFWDNWPPLPRTLPNNSP